MPDTGTQLQFSATFGEQQIPQAVLVRMLCHVALTQIPDRGLGELLDELKQIRDFYCDDMSHQPKQLQTMTTSTVEAAEGRTFEREPFSIFEE